ncbi:MAG: hypothetical protein OXT69_10010 [Candidatus Poribacteria bacterium]|nr:hypothetical protein [Candidatus Poribacteria bacterium]
MDTVTPVIIPTAFGSSGGGIGFVKVKEDEFERIVRKIEKPLVIVQEGQGLIRRSIYAIKYSGFIFYTTTKSDLNLPSGAGTIRAERIHIE